MKPSNTNILLALVASVTFGLAPFKPEPHLFGKMRWVLGGGEGMGMMDYFDLLMHGAPWLILFYLLSKKFFGSAANETPISEILKEDNVTVIDVREQHELSAGMYPNAIHAPLSNFKSHIASIQKMEGKKVLYCISGMRSGRAAGMLKKQGVTDVYNGGGYGSMMKAKNK